MEMAYCPNCGSLLTSEASVCKACGALFGEGSWRPLDALPNDFHPRADSTEVNTSAWMLIALLRWTVYGAISFLMALGTMLAAAYGRLDVWPVDVFLLTFVITWIVLAAMWNSRWKNKIMKFLFA
jgi:hypothetical protein